MTKDKAIKKYSKKIREHYEMFGEVNDFYLAQVRHEAYMKANEDRTKAFTKGVKQLESWKSKVLQIKR